MFKILSFSLFVFLQAGLVKSCAKADKAFLKEGVVVEKTLSAESKLLMAVYKITESDLKLINPATESLTIIEKNKQLASDFAAVKNDNAEKIKIVVDKMANNLTENSTAVYANEIANSNYFLPLCKIVRYRFKNENLNEGQITELLKGNKVDTLQYQPKTLFNIYFMFSKKFSENVLIQVAEKTKCNKIKIAEIKQIAESKGIASSSELYSVLSKCN